MPRTRSKEGGTPRRWAGHPRAVGSWLGAEGVCSPMSLSARLVVLVLAPMIVMLVAYGAVANQLRRRRSLERAAAEVADISVMLRVVLRAPGPRQEPEPFEALLERLTDAKHILGIGVFDAG